MSYGEAGIDDFWPQEVMYHALPVGGFYEGDDVAPDAERCEKLHWTA